MVLISSYPSCRRRRYFPPNCFPATWAALMLQTWRALRLFFLLHRPGAARLRYFEAGLFCGSKSVMHSRAPILWPCQWWGVGSRYRPPGRATAEWPQRSATGWWGLRQLKKCQENKNDCPLYMGKNNCYLKKPPCNVSETEQTYKEKKYGQPSSRTPTFVMGPVTPPFLPSPDTEDVGEAWGGAFVLKEVMAWLTPGARVNCSLSSTLVRPLAGKKKGHGLVFTQRKIGTPECEAWKYICLNRSLKQKLNMYVQNHSCISKHFKWSFKETFYWWTRLFKPIYNQSFFF